MSTPIENNTTALEDLLSEVEDLPPAPSGTKSITENGEYDVSGFASANVNVPGGGTEMTDDEALDYAYELGLVEPFALSGYVLFTDATGKIYVS